MTCIKTQHFSVHRLILLTVGLWPYERSKLTEFQLILFSSILISSVTLQLAIFVTKKCSANFAIKILSYALFFIIYIIEYNSFAMNFKTMKHVLEKLQLIYNELRDKNEIDILKKYGNDAKRYTIILILFHIFNLIGVILLPILLRVFGAFLLINESRSRIMMQKILPEYSIDQENHFYLILLLTDATIGIGGTAIVGTGMMLIAYVKHICGMFAIASYRIKKTITVNREKEIMIYKEIIYAVDIHRKAIEIFEILLSSLQKSHFVLIMACVICLSLNLYKVFENALFGNNAEFYVHLLIVIGLFLFMFFSNYAGQEIMDHNNHIFYTAYSIRWYIAPLNIQKLILFLLQRSSKVVVLNFGGIFVMSIELFATLIKSSVSYFTVMYSMQQ